MTPIFIFVVLVYSLYKLVPVLWRTLVLFARGFLRLLGFVWAVLGSPLWVLFALVWPSKDGSTFESAVPAAWVVLDESEQPSGAKDGVAEVRGLPVTAGLEPARLRRRTVWVRRLESVLGVAPGVVGAFVRGRWVPDLPSNDFSLDANHVLAHLGSGVKILGGGSVLGAKRGDNEPERLAYFVVELSDGSREVVFPELLSHLSSYAFLRERNAVLVGSLRVRALEWCKSAGLSKSVTWMAVPSAFRFAWQLSPREVKSSQQLRGGPGPALWWNAAS